MTSPPDSHGSERRRLRTDTGWSEDLIDAIVFYGLGQVLLLTGLMLWYLFQSPVRRGDVVLGTIVALIGLPLGIGLRRYDVIETGTEWPKIDDATLGTGDGYRMYLARGVFLSAIVGIAAYSAAAVGIVTSGTLVPTAVALASVVGGVLLYPDISGLDRRSCGVRTGLYAIALAGGFYFGAPFVSDVGFHSTYVLYPLLIVLGLLDAFW